MYTPPDNPPREQSRLTLHHTMAKVVCRTICGGIELNVTLAAKQLAKPLTDALLTPFLGAYNKKRPGEEPLTAAALQHA